MIRPKAIAVLQHITKEVQDERLAKVVCRAWLTFLRAVDDTVLMQILSQVSLRGFAACVLFYCRACQMHMHTILILSQCGW